MEQQSAFSIYKKSNKVLETNKTKKLFKHKQKKRNFQRNDKLDNIFKRGKTYENKKSKKDKLLQRIEKSAQDINNSKSRIVAQNGHGKKKGSKKTSKMQVQQIRPVILENDSDSEEIPQLIEMPSSNFNGNNGNTNAVTKILNGEDSYENAKQLLQWILNPMPMREFMDKCWEKGPVHIKRNNKDYFKHLFSSTDLDNMLRDNQLQLQDEVDIVIYEKGVRKDFTDIGGVAKHALVMDKYMDGYSVRIKAPQSYNRKLHNLLSTLQEFFGCFVSANVYLTPPDSQGFAPHYDDIEAFIIQLEGRKHWKLYNPPLPSDELARTSSPNYSPITLTQPPIRELTLHAGDVLYFPRGTVHEGRTDADAHSLHVTVSTYQKTAYVDLLEGLLTQALANAARDDVEYRRGLPVGYLRHAGVVNGEKKTAVRKEIITKVQKLILGLCDHVNVDAAVDEMGRRFMWESLPPVLLPQEEKRTSYRDGDTLLNGRIINKCEFSPDTKIRLLRYHCLRMVLNDNEARIYYSLDNKGFKELEEQHLDIALDEAPIVESLQHAYPEYKSIEWIPHESMESKFNVVQCLWMYGLIVTETILDTVDTDEDDDSRPEVTKTFSKMTTKAIDPNDDSYSDPSSDDEAIDCEGLHTAKKTRVGIELDSGTDDDE